MPFSIKRGDITRVSVDAIVNAANPSLLGGGGVDGKIHQVAGPELLAECALLGGCHVGEAKITKGYRLPCRYVIHTVGPIYKGGGRGEREQLYSCYASALRLARERGCESIAFPLISAGAYGYPWREALNTATDAILAYLRGDCDMDAYLVIYDARVLAPRGGQFRELIEYIERSRAVYPLESCEATLESARAAFPPKPKADARLLKRLDRLDEGFSQALMRLIDEKGMTDVECYKRANIDRKLFSKIRIDARYRPSRQTAVAFAIALRLNLAETKELLGKAGYALSRASEFDVIIEYHIERGCYDVYEINESLYAFDQALLGV